jgi:hypothetical protein
MKFIKGIFFFAIFLFLFGFISMTLWNALIPELFHGPILNYWQALGLLVLGKIFFGGFRGHRGGCHRRSRHWKQGWGGDCGPYMNSWKAQFEKMTPEEKEAWKAKMKNRWKYGCEDWDMENPTPATEKI